MDILKIFKFFKSQKNKPFILEEANIRWHLKSFFDFNNLYPEVHLIEVKGKEISIFCSRPGQIIGPKGETLDKLKWELKLKFDEEYIINLKEFDPFE